MDDTENPNAYCTAYPVVCAGCGLLVGWEAEEPARFLCIPCFDTVPLHEEE
jgi:hypothetical protein